MDNIIYESQILKTNNLFPFSYLFFFPFPLFFLSYSFLLLT
jgi:hypothetical protein